MVKRIPKAETTFGLSVMFNMLELLTVFDNIMLLYIGTEIGVTKPKLDHKKLSFWQAVLLIPFLYRQKFIELQGAMLRANAGLDASHPFASYPSSWPILERGKCVL